MVGVAGRLWCGAGTVRTRVVDPRASRMNHSSVIAAVKDETAQHRVAAAWRPALTSLVAALVERDYGLRRRPATVGPVSPETAEQMRASVEGFGETLVALPEETWATSVSQWMGTHWEVLVDLWTAESGPSDLVLSVRVLEAGAGFLIQVESVHVP